MYSFGKRSLERREQLHPVLQKILDRAIETSPLDFTILCAYRNSEEQQIAYGKGFSNKQFPNSKHNHLPSTAVDIAPYPIVWEDIKQFQILGCHIMMTAYYMGESLRWGGFWCKPKDYPHFELRR
jgi:peptidoglycan LD-endopeptidase CwlK